MKSTILKSIDFTLPTDIVICDPMYVIPESQWAACQYGACPENAGYTRCITAKVGAGERLSFQEMFDGHTRGLLKTDSGYIGVFEMAEVERIYGKAFWSLLPLYRVFWGDLEGDVSCVADDTGSVSIVIQDAASGDVFVSIKNEP